MVTPSRDQAEFHLRQLASDEPQHRFEARRALTDILATCTSSERQKALLSRVMQVTGGLIIRREVERVIGASALNMPDEFPNIFAYFKDRKDSRIVEFVWSTARRAKSIPENFRMACGLLFERPEQITDCLKALKSAALPFEGELRQLLARSIEGALQSADLPSDKQQEVRRFLDGLSANTTPFEDKVIQRLSGIESAMSRELAEAQAIMLGHLRPEIDTAVDWERTRLFVYRFEYDLSGQFSNNRRVLEIVKSAAPTHVFLPELKSGVFLARADTTPSAQLVADTLHPDDREDAIRLVDLIRDKADLIGLGKNDRLDELRLTQFRGHLRRLSGNQESRTLIFDHQANEPIFDSTPPEYRPIHVGECVLNKELWQHPSALLLRHIAAELRGIGVETESSLVIPVEVTHELSEALGSGNFYDFRQYDLVGLRVALGSN